MPSVELPAGSPLEVIEGELGPSLRCPYCEAVDDVVRTSIETSSDSVWIAGPGFLDSKSLSIETHQTTYECGACCATVEMPEEYA